MRLHTFISRDPRALLQNDGAEYMIRLVIQYEFTIKAYGEDAEG